MCALIAASGEVFHDDATLGDVYICLFCYSITFKFKSIYC